MLPYFSAEAVTGLLECLYYVLFRFCPQMSVMYLGFCFKSKEPRITYAVWLPVISSNSRVSLREVSHELDIIQLLVVAEFQVVYEEHLGFIAEEIFMTQS
jgi:hypothetical protein